MTTFPTGEGDAGATNAAPGHTDPGTSAGEHADDLSGSSTWAAIQALAALLEPEAFDPNVKAVPEWREPTKAVAYNHAAKVITSGYRLVSEDEATVDRVAAALREDETAAAITRAYLPDWEHCRESTRESYRVLARAAVRALREAGGEPRPTGRTHDCCPHCTARTGSCVRCGVRDAEAWELCGQCDREVEAEASASRALREAGQ